MTFSDLPQNSGLGQDGGERQSVVPGCAKNVNRCPRRFPHAPTTCRASQLVDSSLLFGLYLNSPSTAALLWPRGHVVMSPKQLHLWNLELLPLFTFSGVWSFSFLLPHQSSSLTPRYHPCPLFPAHLPGLSAPPASFPSLTCLHSTATISLNALINPSISSYPVHPGPRPD